MFLFNRINNLFNAVIGRNQALEQLIEAQDIERALSSFTTRTELIEDAMREYNVKTHSIMERPDKILTNAKGERTGTLKRWKLPVNYPEYINEVALVFLYGQPVLWRNESQEDTEQAFSAFTTLLDKLHFKGKVRECKRLAGSETQSAMLFRPYKDRTGKANCQIRVLARSKGDELYAKWDIYENLTAFAWGYYTKDNKTNTTYHVDFFLPEIIYRCTRGDKGWKVVKEVNRIGKIPVILFEQNKEWNGVEPLIEREEYMASRRGDTNDYFSDPMFFASASLLKSMPEKDDENKTFFVQGTEDVSKVASFLTWNDASASKEQEFDWLQKHIMTKTFTPDIDFEKMKGLSNVSGKALKQMMMLAVIKANRHKEKHDEYMSRVSSLVLSIIGNVLNVGLKSECEKCHIEHDFQEPFGEDITAMIDELIKSKDSELMSQETAVELNPLIRNKQNELERLKREAEEATQAQRDLFGTNQTQDDIFGGAQ